MESNLKLYSLGIVVETKPPGSDYILVTPIEVLNIQPAGNIKSKNIKFEGTISDVNGKNFKSEIRAKNYLKAKWLPLSNSNRITAPDVVANETVILFKFGNVDEYYWTTIFREVELRRLETVLYAFSNIKSGLTPFDKTTSYWLEVDTKNKTVKFHTSMNDGEYTEYDIVINTKEGTLTITDKKKNSIYLDSRSDHLTVTTNSSITANTKSFTVNAPDITLNGNVTITKNLQVNNNTTISNNLQVGNNTVISNNLHVGVNVNAGGLQIGGSVMTPDSLQINGNITASGSIMDTGGNSNHHSHS